MRANEVSFFSQGEKISALWRTPDSFSDRLRTIVQGPGWLGLKDANLYVRYHEALTDAGFGVLIFDYRGFGGSSGERDLSLKNQLEDLVNAVTYLTTRDDVDGDAIGVFGSGGTGGGNAILLAAMDDRIRCAVSQLPVADGSDWLHRMRPEHEWLAFLSELETDRQERVINGHGRQVHPREGIMVPTPERRSTKVKADVDDRVPTSVSLGAADEILAFRPLDAADRLTKPLLIIGVDKDATTPTDHSIRLYEAAKGPKKLIMQRLTTHYASYDQYWGTVTPQIVDWFDAHCRNGPVVISSSDRSEATTEWMAES